MDTARPSTRDRFFLAMSALMLGVAVVGFTPTFYLRPYFFGLPGFVPDLDRGAHAVLALPWHFYFHGIAFTAWFVLVFVQATLVATQRTALHRKLGVVGVAVAACAVVGGILTVAFRDAPLLDSGSLMRSFPNLTLLAVFALCVGAAISLRRRPADHKRLMVFASIAATGPAADRLVTFIGFATGWFSPDLGGIGALPIVLALILTVVAHDVLTERRVHRGTLFGFAAIAVAIGSTLTFVRIGMWEAVMRVLV